MAIGTSHQAAADPDHLGAPFDRVISTLNFDPGDHVRSDAASADEWLYRLERLDTLRFVINATPDLPLRLARS